MEPSRISSISNLLFSCSLFFALSAHAADQRVSAARNQPIADQSAVFIVGTVVRIEPFVYTDGMERVTPLTVVLHPADPASSRVLRVFCIGQRISARCSHLRERDRVQIGGELRNLILVDPAEHGIVEWHTPGAAVTRFKQLPPSAKW